MREISEIAGYHAHVYFDPATRDLAVRIREELGRLFVVELGRIIDIPVGPHIQAMFQVAFAIDQFDKVVPWLMLNREGLSVLVHPRTDDELADHVTNPLWLGEQLPINVAFLEAETAAKK
jgi:aromatic ring-cleaving dioxygenase